jgi:hypothetical protein
MNHVGDGYFTSMYFWAFVSVLIFLLSFYISLRLKVRFITILSAITIFFSLLNVATIVQMNRTKALVTYSEYAQIMGP